MLRAAYGSVEHESRDYPDTPLRTAQIAQRRVQVGFHKGHYANWRLPTKTRCGTGAFEVDKRLRPPKPRTQPGRVPITSANVVKHQSRSPDVTRRGNRPAVDASGWDGRHRPQVPLCGCVTRLWTLARAHLIENLEHRFGAPVRGLVSMPLVRRALSPVTSPL
jgi:hypothetical protein